MPIVMQKRTIRGSFQARSPPDLSETIILTGSLNLFSLFRIYFQEVRIQCLRTASSPLLGLWPRLSPSPGATSQSGCAASLCQGPDLVSSLIEAILSSDEDRMQKKLAGLADYLSGKSSSAAWLNLGRLAASLFFRRAAEEYFEKSARLAQAQGDGEGQSQAWSLFGQPLQ